MTSSAPTIVRTEHKFGDYLSKPDMARFELPRKTSRPLIVNKSYGMEKIDKNREKSEYEEHRNVFPKMKQNKYERRKMVGSNKKDVRNINDIIASDNQNLTQIDTTQPSSTNESKSSDDKTTQWTYHHQNENVPSKMSDMNPHDAIIDKFHRTPQEIQTNCHQENDEEMDEKMRNLERDIELEQQQMMNRLYNNPSTFDSSFVSVGLMPVMVHNPAGGYYIVHLPIHPPPPPPQYHPDSIYSTSSSCCYPVSHSSTSSSISRLSSDEGFVDDNESNDDAISLVESFEDKLEISEEESDEDDELNRLDIEQDEELNRLVLSIIDDE